MAREQQAILLTFDKDFGELVFRQNQASSGIILLRLYGYSPQQKADILIRSLQEHGEALGNAFTVITPTKIRIRPSSS